MSTKNNLLRKYFIDYYISIISFSTLGILSGCFLRKTIMLANERLQWAEQNNERYDPDATLPFLCILVMAVCFTMVYCGTKSMIQDSKGASRITKKYLQMAMELYPGLKEYKNVLNDKKSVENITDVICNALPEEEQEKIIKILESYNSAETKTQYAKNEKTAQMISNIITVLNNYAVKHPEFVEQIYFVMQNSSKTYFVRMNQRIR